ncbi:hypothetical protein [Streptomyces sp. TRM64462]|uniref:hypothetical protein n=1 Tax=Streptomyces sp. TRM64462 TaxID=2741726 RepID=UPI0015862AF5|nr:hypothetical protein [Streptomyces sp. TRM64462]
MTFDNYLSAASLVVALASLGVQVIDPRSKREKDHDVEPSETASAKALDLTQAASRTPRRTLPIPPGREARSMSK